MADIRFYIRKAKKQGDSGLWKLCFFARHTIDKTPHGQKERAVMDFCADIRRSGRTVYKYKAAADVFLDLYRSFLNLRANFPGRNYGDLYNLPHTHFLVIGELTSKLDLSPLESLHYLFDDLDLRYSSSRLQEDITKDNSDRNPKPEPPTLTFERETGKALYSLEEASFSAPNDDAAQAVLLAVDTVRNILEQSDGQPPWYPIAWSLRSGALALGQREDVPDGLSVALIALAEAIEQAIEES